MLPQLLMVLQRYIRTSLPELIMYVHATMGAYIIIIIIINFIDIFRPEDPIVTETRKKQI